MARTKFVRLIISLAWLTTFADPVHSVVVLRSLEWSELTPEQRDVLMPLSDSWYAMEASRRAKWLGIAQRYGGLTPEEKGRMQERMKEWARLAPAERKAAREGFSALRNAPPEHRQAMKDTIRQQWQEYRALTETERIRLSPALAGESRR